MSGGGAADQPSRVVMVVAGEASGDHHAAAFVRELKAIAPDLQFFGTGGDAMRRQGVEILVDIHQLAVMGLVEILGHLPTLIGAFRKVRAEMEHRRPDLLVLVDYPEFNLRLAAKAKRIGVPVLYYVSPQIWAWRQHRVHKIARLVDRMAVLFPFEVDFYRQANVQVDFVGHPLVAEVTTSESPAETRARLGFDVDDTVIGLMPGSRIGEVTRLMPLMVETAQELARTRPGLRFVLPVAPTVDPGTLDAYLQGTEVDVTLVADRRHEAIAACDAMVTASGTATLEIALLGVPMVVVYKLAALTYVVGKRLIKVDHIAICNIVADARVVPELIQDAATPNAVASAVNVILDDDEHRREMVDGLARVRQALGEPGGSAKLAAIALRMIEDRSGRT